jgi:hypothetical protein
MFASGKCVGQVRVELAAQVLARLPYECILLVVNYEFTKDLWVFLCRFLFLLSVGQALGERFLGLSAPGHQSGPQLPYRGHLNEQEVALDLALLCYCQCPLHVNVEQAHLALPCCLLHLPLMGTVIVAVNLLML